MAKPQPPYDVLVLGAHPAAYFAALLLRQKSPLRVAHATIPGENAPPRLSLINPGLFALHPALEPLKKRLSCTSVWGTQFLADDGSTRSEHRAKGAIAHVAECEDVRAAMAELAEKAGAEMYRPKEHIDVTRVDESGLEVVLGRDTLRAKVLILAGELPAELSRVLGIPETWPRELLRRYSFLRVKGPKFVEVGSRPMLPMSLDLRGALTWAWMLPHKDQVQLAAEQPIDVPPGTKPPLSPQELMAHWADVLHRHGVLKTAAVPVQQTQVMDLPLAGALEREGVANRTLLIGPAGGFFSATGEDLYPNCWSALFAVDTVRKALKEPHLQDALQPYRQQWGSTLGDYLRGPQQNLRFLMPMVYRNPNMTTRLSESILLGKAVVR